MGNILRGDDGFGIRVVAKLSEISELPAGVEIYEAGIGGIALVQELMNGYDALIIVDAVEKGAEPGSLFVLEPLTPDTKQLDAPDAMDLHQSMADAHFTEPAKVLLLARALDVCPPKVLLVGCQPACVEDLVERLDPAVERAVPLAVERILALIEELKL